MSLGRAKQEEALARHLKVHGKRRLGHPLGRHPRPHADQRPLLRNEVNEAPTKLNNVASTYPIKLAQMKALFDDEAKANNVYPLINSPIR